MPEPGDVLLVRGRGPIERTVEWTTTSAYSHAAMLAKPGLLIESKEFHGVRFVPTSTYRGDWYQVVCDEPTRLAALAFAQGKWGSPYGWREALDEGLRDILHIRSAGERWRKWRHFDCSALLVAAYFKAGLVLTYRSNPAPGDLGFSPLLRKLKEEPS